MRAALLTLSTILAVVGSTIYIVSILRGRTKPHRTTRFVLMIVLALNFISILAAQGNVGAKLYGGIICFYGFAYFVASIGRGMGGSTIFDWTCLVLALAGVVGWQVTNNPVLGIWFAGLADFVAYMPAFLKTWQHPYTETPWLYICSFFSALLSLVAYKVAAESAFQLVSLLCCVIMLTCIYHTKLSPFRRSSSQGSVH